MSFVRPAIAAPLTAARPTPLQPMTATLDPSSIPLIISAKIGTVIRGRSQAKNRQCEADVICLDREKKEKET